VLFYFIPFTTLKIYFVLFAVCNYNEKLNPPIVIRDNQNKSFTKHKQKNMRLHKCLTSTMLPWLFLVDNKNQYYKNNVKIWCRNFQGWNINFEPTTLRDLVGCSNHWATGDYGEQGSLQLHAALSVSFWNGWYCWIFEHEGSVYSFGHYLRPLLKTTHFHFPLSVLFVSKKVRYFGRRSGSRRKRLQKTATIAKLSYLEWTELWTYPFVLKLVNELQM